MKIQRYSITFDSKGNYSFKEVEEKEGVEILVKKDKWDYEESTGVWYHKNSREN